jgi:Asp-tRNA(Asn)/Glu-tRNA(Gln) amidotransferase C subunit
VWELEVTEKEEEEAEEQKH